MLLNGQTCPIVGGMYTKKRYISLITSEKIKILLNYSAVGRTDGN